MNSPLIIIPKLIPPGPKAQYGVMPKMPTCERCWRPSTERNPIFLTERPSWTGDRVGMRRDAICNECRLAMKGHF